jgi:hypothetical protein
MDSRIFEQNIIICHDIKAFILRGAKKPLFASKKQKAAFLCPNTEGVV